MVTWNNRKTMSAHTKLDNTVRAEGMSRSLKSRAPSLYHQSTLLLGNVSDDYQNTSADCKTYANSIHHLASRDLLTTAEDH